MCVFTEPSQIHPDLAEQVVMSADQSLQQPVRKKKEIGLGTSREIETEE